MLMGSSVSSEQINISTPQHDIRQLHGNDISNNAEMPSPGDANEMDADEMPLVESE